MTRLFRFIEFGWRMDFETTSFQFWKGELLLGWSARLSKVWTRIEWWIEVAWQEKYPGDSVNVLTPDSSRRGMNLHVWAPFARTISRQPTQDAPFRAVGREWSRNSDGPELTMYVLHFLDYSSRFVVGTLSEITWSAQMKKYWGGDIFRGGNRLDHPDLTWLADPAGVYPQSSPGAAWNASGRVSCRRAEKGGQAADNRAGRRRLNSGNWPGENEARWPLKKSSSTTNLTPPQ